MDDFRRLDSHMDYCPKLQPNTIPADLPANETKNNSYAESNDEFLVINDIPPITSSQPQSLFGAIKEKAFAQVTNLYFQISDESLKVTVDSLLKSKLILLGHAVQSQEEAKHILDKLIYFSYRKFDYPIIYKGAKFYTDNLWGCTLRASQMLFAIIYQRAFPKVSRFQIIDLFKEYKEPSRSPFSIYRICEVGSTTYTGKPGNYWNCLTALLSLKDLFLSQPANRDKYDFLVFHNNLISFQEFERGDFGVEEFLMLGDDEQGSLDVEVFHKQKLVYFVGFMGTEKISEANFECLKVLMGLPTFCGMLGGVGTKAHYVYGATDSKFLYMDPHLVQVSLCLIQNFDSKQYPEYNSYQVNMSKINMISYRSFDPSLVLVFLISNKAELEYFKTTFISLSNMSQDFLSSDTDLMSTSEMEGKIHSLNSSVQFMEPEESMTGIYSDFMVMK